MKTITVISQKKKQKIKKKKSSVYRSVLNVYKNREKINKVYKAREHEAHSDGESSFTTKG